MKGKVEEQQEKEGAGAKVTSSSKSSQPNNYRRTHCKRSGLSASCCAHMTRIRKAGRTVAYAALESAKWCDKPTRTV